MESGPWPHGKRCFYGWTGSQHYVRGLWVPTVEMWCWWNLWCSRPRLYWLTWDIQESAGAVLHLDSVPQEVQLTAFQDLQEVCQEGWIKTDPTRPYPTFTTSRPRALPGRRPAGLAQCTQEEIRRWELDSYRYPPYQYARRNLLGGRSGEVRLPSIEEKEFIMGFPVGYTMNCVNKQSRGTTKHSDARHTLIGNSWSVQVVSWLLAQLFGTLGLCPKYTPQELVNLMTPDGQVFLQSRLWRRPLQPLRGNAPDCGPLLVQKLSNMISVKGEDIMLSAPPASSASTRGCEHLCHPGCGSGAWYPGGHGQAQRSISIHWNFMLSLPPSSGRLQHRGQVGHRFIHLVDSLVVLHALSRGRSSSRKLRSSLAKINALLLCSSSQALWGYVHTDQNPADKPSRWGRKVKTKFRHA